MPMPEFIWELPAVRPTPTEEVGVGEGIIDHAEAAVNRLAIQFRKPKIEAFVRALCKQMQPLEVALNALLTQRGIDVAIGAQLDLLGKLVGQEQIDVADTTYRSLIRARIRANRSSGMGNQILLVARLVFTDYAAQDDVVAAGVMKLEIANRNLASFALIAQSIALPWELAELFVTRFLRKIVGDGIRGVFEFTVLEDGDALDVFDEDFAFDDSWQASLVINNQIRVWYKDGAATNNGNVLHITESFVSFDLDPTAPNLTIETGVTTVGDARAVIDNGGFSPYYTELVGSTVDGDIMTMTLPAAITFAGGVAATDGTGFGDVVGYPQTEIAINSIFQSTVDWDHIHLCDDPDTQDSALLGGLDFPEFGGSTPTYHQPGVYGDEDYAFGIGSGDTGFFAITTGDLQAGATDDFAFLAVIPKLGAQGAGVDGFFPFNAFELLGKNQQIKIVNGLLTFNCFNGSTAYATAGIAAPTDQPFVVAGVLERGRAKMRAGLCAIGGTAIVSAELDATGLGDLTLGGGAFTCIGLGDFDEHSTMSFWAATKGLNKCQASGGASANLAARLQAFADYLVTTGGLRAAME
jgi:hypothetical protein